MADSDNQQKSSVNDNSSSHQDFTADLKQLAHAIYNNRDDESKWQELLQQATDEVIAMVSADPSVLSDVLGAESEAAVDSIIDGIVEKHKGTGSSISEEEPVSEASVEAQAQESKAEISASGQKQVAGDGTTSEGGSVEAATQAEALQPTEDDQPAEPKGMQASDQQQSAGHDGQIDQADSASQDGERCSNEEFSEFLASIYAVKDKEDGVDRLLENANNKLMERLYSNPFYLTRVMEMTNENELRDLLELLSRPSGPFYADDQPPMTVVTDENIDYVLDNYAYINFDCAITDPENTKLKELIKSMPEPSWFSSTGVPVSCQLSDDQKTLTVAVSLRGTLEGFDSAYTADTGSGEGGEFALDILDSAASKRMIVAAELLEMIQSMALEQVKIRSGRRVMMRNLWALLTVNDIPIAGFEPSPSEQAWLDKRSHFLTDRFRYQVQATSTAAPGLGVGATSPATPITDGGGSDQPPVLTESSNSESDGDHNQLSQDDQQVNQPEAPGSSQSASEKKADEKTTETRDEGPETIDVAPTDAEAASSVITKSSTTAGRGATIKKKPSAKKEASAAPVKKSNKKSTGAAKSVKKTSSKTDEKKSKKDES